MATSQRCPAVRTKPEWKWLENIRPTFGGYNPKSIAAAFAPNLKVNDGSLQSNRLASRNSILSLFTVQWSTHADFAVAGGELEVRDTIWKRGGGDDFNEVNVTVTDCPSNARCYFRVAAGNLSGYGSFKTTLPSSVLLSGQFS